MAEGTCIVADFGKTNAKLTLWSPEGECLARETRANAVQVPGAYLPLDIVGITDWLVQTLQKFAGHPVQAIIPVAHGAAVAGVRGDRLAFAPPDYEWELPAEMLNDYRKQRDAFAVTGSPAFPMGLNIGSQLHYLESLGALDGAVLMPYAQYWAWLLSGAATSEVTSLGCHSDLWCPAAQDWSPMAKARGWGSQFAPLVRAGDVIGTLRPDLAAQTGLSPAVRIHAGLHDSNAALVAARGFHEIAEQEATVLSTGTWFVSMRSPQEPVDLSGLPETRDCLVNVDVAGRPVPSARYMGGRELERLGAVIDVPGIEGLAEALASGAMILPAMVPDCGPFPEARGSWINEPADAAPWRAAAALYAAMMAKTSLDLISAKGTLLIEGRFARSDLFTRALASLSLETQVYTASAEADVSFGALRVIDPAIRPAGELVRVEPLEQDVRSYYARWLARTKVAG